MSDLRVHSDPTPSDCCWFFILVSGYGKPCPAPAPPMVHEAMGLDGDVVARFFQPEDYARDWVLPLTLTWGTADELRITAGWWREARLAREARTRGDSGFMSLDEINAAWVAEEKH